MGLLVAVVVVSAVLVEVVAVEVVVVVYFTTSFIPHSSSLLIAILANCLSAVITNTQQCVRTKYFSDEKLPMISLIQTRDVSWVRYNSIKPCQYNDLI